MKIAPPLVFAAALFAGCTSARYSPLPTRQVLKDYRAVEPGMTEKRLYALLGRPDRIGRDGILHWWADGVEGERPSHADIDVTLGPDAKVAGTQIHSDEGLEVTGVCLGMNATLSQGPFQPGNVKN